MLLESTLRDWITLSLRNRIIEIHRLWGRKVSHGWISGFYKKNGVKLLSASYQHDTKKTPEELKISRIEFITKLIKATEEKVEIFYFDEVTANRHQDFSSPNFCIFFRQAFTVGCIQNECSERLAKSSISHFQVREVRVSLC